MAELDLEIFYSFNLCLYLHINHYLNYCAFIIYFASLCSCIHSTNVYKALIMCQAQQHTNQSTSLLAFLVGEWMLNK